MNNFFSPKGKFTGNIMPSFIQKRKDLTGNAKVLYPVLANLAGESDHCWPSQKYLADETGMTVRSVQSCIKELVALGLIETKAGKFGSTLKYYFVKTADVELRTSSNTLTILPSVNFSNSNTQVYDDSKAKNNPVCTYAKVAGGYANFSYINNLK